MAIWATAQQEVAEGFQPLQERELVARCDLHLIRSALHFDGSQVEAGRSVRELPLESREGECVSGQGRGNGDEGERLSSRGKYRNSGGWGGGKGNARAGSPVSAQTRQQMGGTLKGRRDLPW